MPDPDLIAELDWCPACAGSTQSIWSSRHPWEPGDPDLCPGHDAQAEAELELEARDG